MSAGWLCQLAARSRSMAVERPYRAAEEKPAVTIGGLAARLHYDRETTEGNAAACGGRGTRDGCLHQQTNPLWPVTCPKSTYSKRLNNV